MRVTGNERLRIGYVTTDLSSSAGWGRYSRSLTESVAEYADVVVLTSVLYANDTTLKNVRVALPSPSFALVAQVRTFLAILRHLRGCHVIHCLVEPYAPAAALAGLLLRIPVTMTLHGTYSVPPAQTSLKRAVMRFMYARMPIVTTGSTYTEKKAREHARLGECRFIPNGVNLEKFKRDSSVGKGPLVLSVGMLKRRKGVDIALEAIARARAEVSDIRYVIVAADSNDSFSERVHALVEERGLTDIVEFKQRIPDTELVRLYNEARAFVLLARSNEDSFEGFPMVYYEANACGTPVVTTAGFGSEYAIKEGQNGFLVPQEDPEAASEAIKKLLLQEGLFARMSEAALREARAHTWDKIALLLLGMYKDTIAAS